MNPRYHRSSEPLWWLPFSVGMMLDALLMPALLIITGILIPIGIVTGNVRGLIQNPFIQALLFLLIAFTFFHAAHRTRFVLADLGIKAPLPLALICYGGAIFGTFYAAGIFLHFI